MNKKNKILFFLFSLIPGAAHMYIGLVKRGLVIMLALVAGAGLAMMADTPAFLLVLPVLWFYSCLLYTSPSPRDYAASRMPSSA